MPPESSFGTAPALERSLVRTLPPLILHPFADAGGPSKLVESSRANLKLQGLLPQGEATREDLDRALLDGRYSELRMLYYVGKDLARWIEQCIEFAERHQDSLPRGICYQSFAALLIHDAPPAVQAKLRKWGVGDYKSIFSRALGLHTLFAAAPPREMLADEFVRAYFRYADQIFLTKQGECDFVPLTAREFNFELYSSGEYARMLERSWEES
ncbi:MAG TPA: hypothetical protein VME17_04010 [Bryobacteraceae bacterium]|nr:hypothetical protein [Bryobacteraceae bacterium]